MVTNHSTDLSFFRIIIILGGLGMVMVGVRVRVRFWEENLEESYFRKNDNRKSGV
jgi:hypothetical protein